MGKGDKKSKRGKITLGTFGVRRLRKKGEKIVAANIKTKEETVVIEEIVSAPVENIIEPKVEKTKAPIKRAKSTKENKEAKTDKPVKAKEPKAKKEKKAE